MTRSLAPLGWLSALGILALAGAYFGWRILGSGALHQGRDNTEEVIEHAELVSNAKEPVGDEMATVTAEDATREVSTGLVGSTSSRDAAEESGARLVGRVLDATGGPLEGAFVLAISQYELPVPLETEGLRANGMAYPAVRTTTRKDGRFELKEGLQPGWYLSCCVLSPTHAPWRQPRGWYNLKSTTDLGDIQLLPGVNLSGRVVNPAGEGIAFAEILLGLERGMPGIPEDFPGRGLPLGQSDASGRFAVSGIAPGRWLLLFDAPGYEVGELRGADPTPGASVEDLTVTLSQGARVSGKLTGRPPDVVDVLEVEARPIEGTGEGRSRVRRAPIDTNGEFEIGGLVPGRDIMLVVRRRLADGSRERVDAIDPVKIETGRSDALLEWTGPTGLSAQMIDAVTGEAVEKALVLIEEDGGWFGIVRTPDGAHPGDHYPRGRIYFEGLAGYAGEREIRLQAPGYAELTIPAAIAKGEVTDLRRVELQPGPAIDLTVIDGPSGEPVEGAKAFLADDEGRYLSTHIRIGPHEPGWARYGVTDAHGHTLLSTLEGEHCLLAVTAPDRAISWVKLGQLTKRDSRELEVTVRPGAQLDVHLTDAVGDPVGSAIIEYKHPDDQYFAHMASMSAADGIAHVRDIPPGPLLVRVRHERRSWIPEDFDYDATWNRLDLKEGELTELHLETHRRYGLGGRVHEGGRALGGAVLYLDPENKDQGNYQRLDRKARRTRFQEVADADGRFQFNNIDDGRYDLVIEHRSRAMNARIPIVMDDEQDLDLDLPVCILEGAITDAAGSPVEGATIRLSTPIPGYSAGEVGTVVREAAGGHLVISDGGRRLDETRSGSGGTYTLRGIAPGVALEMRVHGPYFVEARAPLGSMAHGETRSFDLVIEHAGRLLVSCDRDALGVSVRAVRVGTDEAYVKALMPNALFEGCRAGKWRLEILKGEGAGQEVLETRTVELKARETSRVSVQQD